MSEARVRGARVLVRPDEQQMETADGIVIPELAKEEQNTGTVLMVGDKVTDLAPGDRVLWGQYSGADLDYLGKPAKLLRDEDVCMVLDPVPMVVSE